MPDTKFLDRLHGDSPAARYDLLPEELRDSYRELLEACAEAHAESIAPSSLGRARKRWQARRTRKTAAARTSDADFGREIRAMIQRAPWYGISLVVHIVALFVLHLFVHSSRPVESDPQIEAVSDLAPPQVEPPFRNEVDSSQMEPEEPEEERIFDEDMPDVEEDPIPERAPDKLRPRDLTIRIPALTRPGTPLTGDIDRDQARAMKVVQAGLGDGLRKARGLSRDRILVRWGDFDHIEKVLEVHGIPHTVFRNLRKVRLRKEQILFLNCSRRPKLGADAAKMRAFVEAGGWVMTSDWALDPFLTGAFPDLARVVKPRRHQPHIVVGVEAVVPRHPLLRKVFARGRKTVWWLEETSTHFRVDRRRVAVLISSKDMERRYGQSVIAFQATPGRGRVVHVLGHFYQERGNLEGVAGM